ncbi:MAG: tetratricopeptide repeat protein [Symploca sp. SIO1B1]|nr:tetratricopeptide repeat protein [Symploca sp. SIO1B1]
MLSIFKWSLSLALTLLPGTELALATTSLTPSEEELNYSDAPIYLASCRWWHIFTDECNAADPRSGIKRNTPYIITPHRTKVQQQPPLVRWNAVEGITQYKVQVKGPDLQYTSEIVIDNAWQYPADLPLEPGITYTIMVIPQGQSCIQIGSELPCEGKFTVLTNQQSAQLEEDLVALPLFERSNPLKMASIYQKYELYADAIDALEKAISAGSNSREYNQFLGELYKQVGLYDLALDKYQEALRLAEEEKDVLVQAKLSAAMGELNFTLTNYKEAGRWFEQAKAHLEKLVYDKEIEGLEQRINDALERVD